MCHTCQPFHFLDSIDGTCEACNDNKSSPWWVYIVVVVLCAALAWPMIKLYEFGKACLVRNGCMKNDDDKKDSDSDSDSDAWYVASPPLRAPTHS